MENKEEKKIIGSGYVVELVELEEKREWMCLWSDEWKFIYDFINYLINFFCFYC